MTPDKLLNVNRREDGGRDLFTTVNRLQENAVRGGIRFMNPQHRRMTTREVKGIDQLVKLNKAIWNLGEQMMQLKAA